MRTSRLKPLSALLAALLLVLLAVPARATTLTQVGIKNFERGHLAYLRNDMEEAARYFARSADAFLKYRTANGSLFDSYALQAGIGLYYSGDYARCIQIMEPLAGDSDLWEADIYGALSYARQGNKDKAIELLEEFPGSPRQHILSMAVNDVLDGLRSGSMTLSQATDTLTSEIRRQLIFNIYAQSQDVAHAPERCDGRFWWRYASQRCTSGARYDRFND